MAAAPPLEAMDNQSGVLAAARVQRELLVAAEAAQFRLAVEWAGLHPAESL